MSGEQVKAEALVKRLAEALHKLVWAAWPALNGAEKTADDALNRRGVLLNVLPRAKRDSSPATDSAQSEPNWNEDAEDRETRENEFWNRRIDATHAECVRRHHEMLDAIATVEAAISGVDQFIRPIEKTAPGEWTTELKGDLHRLQSIVDARMTRPDHQRCVELVLSLNKRLVRLQDLDLSWLSEERESTAGESREKPNDGDDLNAADKIAEHFAAERAKAVGSPKAFRDYLLTQYDAGDIWGMVPDDDVMPNWRGIVNECWDMARELAQKHHYVAPPPLPAIDSDAAAKSAIDQLVRWVDSIREPAQAKDGDGVAGEESGERPADRESDGDIELHMQRVAQAVGDENAARILAIAQRKDLSGEEKYIEILRVDRRFEGKQSAEIGILTGVTDAAVRQWETWKLIQARKKSLD